MPNNVITFDCLNTNQSTVRGDLILCGLLPDSALGLSCEFSPLSKIFAGGESYAKRR
jgi:hypothetical protein